MKNLIEKFLQSVLKLEGPDACWLWTGFCGKRKNKNYGYCYLLEGEQQAHRVSFRLFKEPIPDGAHILHNCDNPPCVNPDHLRAGTPQDNVDDRESRGRSRHHTGEAHGRAKLSQDQVNEIRQSYIPLSNGICIPKGHTRIGSFQHIADKYGVSKRTIRLIILGETWKITN